MLRDDYAKQYWQLGNVVTGFSVVQSLTGTFYFLTNDRFSCVVLFSPQTKYLVIGTGIFMILYIAAVLAIHRRERSLLSAEDTLKLDERSIVAGRIVTIVVFNSLFIFAATGPFLLGNYETWRTFCLQHDKVPAGIANVGPLT
jgi:hypothetical protein